MNLKVTMMKNLKVTMMKKKVMMKKKKKNYIEIEDSLLEYSVSDSLYCDI